MVVRKQINEDLRAYCMYIYSLFQNQGFFFSLLFCQISNLGPWFLGPALFQIFFDIALYNYMSNQSIEIYEFYKRSELIKRKRNEIYF